MVVTRGPRVELLPVAVNIMYIGHLIGLHAIVEHLSEWCKDMATFKPVEPAASKKYCKVLSGIPSQLSRPESRCRTLLIE